MSKRKIPKVWVLFYKDYPVTSKNVYQLPGNDPLGLAIDLAREVYKDANMYHEIHTKLLDGQVVQAGNFLYFAAKLRGNP